MISRTGRSASSAGRIFALTRRRSVWIPRRRFVSSSNVIRVQLNPPRRRCPTYRRRRLTKGAAGRRRGWTTFLIASAIDAIQARRTDLGHRSSSVREQSPAIAYSESVSPRLRPQAPPVQEPAALDLPSVAQLCTRLGCAQEANEVTTALEEASDLLDAVGLILWIPDSLGLVLTPVFAHGYPDQVIAHSSRVSTDADNASAEAFRTLTTCLVGGGESRTGAVVAPLLTPMGCAGVLAVELRSGVEQREDVRAAITILAAQLSTLMGFSVLAQTLSA